MASVIALIVVGASELIALWCIVRIWRSGSSLLAKASWSLVVLVPLVGPLMFGGLWHGLPPNPRGAEASPFDLSRHDPG